MRQVLGLEEPGTGMDFQVMVPEVGGKDKPYIERLSVVTEVAAVKEAAEGGVVVFKITTPLAVLSTGPKVALEAEMSASEVRLLEAFKLVMVSWSLLVTLRVALSF